MSTTNVRGFTFIELALVLIIMGVLMSVGISLLSGVFKSHKLGQSRFILQSDKDAIIGFVLQSGHFPCPDSDGDGLEDRDASGNCSCVWPHCYLPYKEINARYTDAYHHKIYYFVDNNFTKFPDIRGFCVHAPSLTPQVQVKDGTKQYAVVGVLISAGFGDKDGDGLLLDGENVDGSPFFSQSVSPSNIYDDLVSELSLGEVYSKVCDNQLSRLKIHLTNGYLCHNGHVYGYQYSYIFLSPNESVFENSCQGTERSYIYLRNVDINLNGIVSWDGNSWSDE